jgi:hypothetical protein
MPCPLCQRNIKKLYENSFSSVLALKKKEIENVAKALALLDKTQNH